MQTDIIITAEIAFRPFNSDHCKVGLCRKDLNIVLDNEGPWNPKD